MGRISKKVAANRNNCSKRRHSGEKQVYSGFSPQSLWREKVEGPREVVFKKIVDLGSLPGEWLPFH